LTNFNIICIIVYGKKFFDLEEKIMKTLEVILGSINDVKDFVNSVSKYSFDIDLTSGRYVVDAKSIMGIFSLDLSKPIKVEIHSDDCEQLLSELAPFVQ